MHICISKLTIIGSDNGLSPGHRQTIIWTNARILFIGSFGTKFSEILIEIVSFSLKKMHLKISSAKWRPICLGLNGHIFPMLHMSWQMQHWGNAKYMGHTSFPSEKGRQHPFAWAYLPSILLHVPGCFLLNVLHWWLGLSVTNPSCRFHSHIFISACHLPLDKWNYNTSLRKCTRFCFVFACFGNITDSSEGYG